MSVTARPFGLAFIHEVPKSSELRALGMTLLEPRLLRTNLSNRRSLPPHASTGVIDRPRLTGIASLLVRHRLALVHAPAGSGKTTLLAQWHHAVGEAGIHTLWYSASDDDKDPLGLAEYLLLAIDQATGGTADLVTVAERAEALRRLVSKISDIAAEHAFALFIDDYHLAEARDGPETVNTLLAARLPNLTIVLASRNRPSLAVGRFRANGEMIEVSVEDLRFDESETEDFFRLVSGAALTPSESRQMRDHTEGWAAGLRLVSLVLGRTPGNFMETAPAGSHRAFADYFLEEVIAGLPEPVCDFLARTSILESFDVELCNAVTGRTDAAAILSVLEGAQLFIVALPGAQRWYKYHHLFQEFLQTRFYDAGFEAFCEAHEQAARWFISSGSSVDAVRHAFLARRPQWAAELIETYCLYDYLSHGRFETYARWMQQLPRDSREERPLLMFLLVWRSINLRRFLQAEQTLTAIEEAASEPSSRFSVIARETGVDIRGRLHLMRTLIGAYGGDLAAGAAHLAELGDRELDRLAFGRVDLDSIRSYLAYHDGDLVRAERLTFKAKGVYDEMACHWGGIHARSIAVMSYLARGWFGEAEAIVKDTLAIARRHFAEDSYMIALPSALLGAIAFNAGDLQAAEDLWLRAIPLEKSTNVAGLSERVLIPTIGLARLYDRQGRSDAASGVLIRASRRAYETEDFRLEFQLSIEQTDRALRLGDSAEGRRGRERLDLQLAEAQKRFPRWAWQIWDGFDMVEARILAAAGQPEAAAELLAQAGSVARTQGRLVGALQFEALAVECLRGSSAPGVADGAIRRIRAEAARSGFERSIDAFLEPRPQPSAAAHGPTRRPSTVRAAGHGLTAREDTVLELLQWGLSNQAIAARLGINVNTVKSHVKNIFEKLHVKTRTQAILKTLEK